MLKRDSVTRKRRLARGPKVASRCSGPGDVAVRVEGELGPGQPDGVDQTGVESTVGDDEISVGGEGGDGGEVGLVAGRKEQRALATYQTGEIAFQGQVLWKGAADQPGCPGPEPRALGGFAGSAQESGVAREAEVVVAAEGSEVGCPGGDVRPGRSVDAGAGAKPVGLLDSFQLGVELAGQGR